MNLDKLSQMCPAAKGVRLGELVAQTQVRTVSGAGWIVDLDAGDSVDVTITHEEFGLAAPPEFSAGSLEVTLLLEGTTNDQFKVRVTRPAGTTGTDYGYGGASADYSYTWTRRGIG